MKRLRLVEDSGIWTLKFSELAEPIKKRPFIFIRVCSENNETLGRMTITCNRSNYLITVISTKGVFIAETSDISKDIIINKK